ncbi:uncharacterized protein NESG_00477 [Nematocida ausubeli]|uniref:t-SNARE coiled-coil homology domain-containing protein n=1 Tax=Nematocida ausubeli (strain ATCC PRA-371 / ERTm2) TaxID=1913371 RepID=A0A086J5I1_NEMA1|nr:uncharacterized protein NESG_00477 [Nematocida ausubeli]KFG27399.1 hypothetical protein NESG_00477 [Nematocida ausubeli]
MHETNKHPRMRNRSEELKKKRVILYEKIKIKEKTEVQFLFSRISNSLIQLEELIISVEKECIKYSIPRFTSKSQIIDKIEENKQNITVILTKARAALDYFSQKFHKSINHGLVESISIHFQYKIDTLIKRMHISLQEIEKIQTKHIQMHKDTTGIDAVYKSVHIITELIRELKTVVISQSDKIDRLDVAMDYITTGSNKCVAEIGEISVFGSHIKNRIISVLFCCIFILVVLSTIKAYSHSVVKRVKIVKE